MGAKVSPGDSRETRHPRRGWILALSLTLAVFGTTIATEGVAAATEEPDAFVRVVVDSAELRSGPSISSRVIYTAHRGETFAVDGRQGTGFWLRVVLPDGRTAYGLGDEMVVFAVRPGEPEAPSRPGFFATPPLEGAVAGFAILGGVLAIPIRDNTTRAFGYLEGRPSIVVHRTVTLDGYIGDALTADGSQILYGGGATVHFAPSWPICPFLGIGGGGLTVRPNADSFVLKREDLYMARAGGGILMALRGRILVRLEVTNMALFDSESLRNAQTYAGGLGVYF
jgi:hypothetical protein